MRLSKSTWLMLALIWAAILIVASELASLRKQIQLASHKAVVSEMRAALIEVWVARHLRTSSSEMQALAGDNPIRLLPEPPEGYLGEFNVAPEDMENVWFFNTHTQCLVYVFDENEQLAYKLKSTAGLPAAAVGMIGGLDLVRDSACVAKPGVALQ